PLRDIYRDLIKLRKQHACFLNDRVTWLRNSNEANVVTFLRAEDEEEFLIAINFCNRPSAATLELPGPAQFKSVKISGMAEPPGADWPGWGVKGFDWRIYRRAVKQAQGS